MTRQEEIQKAAIDDCATHHNPYGVYSFIAGAEWADKNPVKEKNTIWHNSNDAPQKVGKSS